jgi:DNA repair exonuclease SbcCD ATPase subunit
MNDEIEQLHKKIAYLTEQAERWEDDALRLMKERNEALGELRKAETECSMLRVECGVIEKERNEAMQKCDEHLIKTLQAYDRLAILMENIMEHWLEGTNNPPPELIDAYYDVKDDINDHLNVDRLHEQVIPPNAEFYNTIQQKFKFDFDDTPNLW